MISRISLTKKLEKSELIPDKIADKINAAANLIKSEITNLNASVTCNNDEITYHMDNITTEELRECFRTDDSRLLSTEASIGDVHLWAIPQVGQLNISAPNKDIAEMVLSAFLTDAEKK